MNLVPDSFISVFAFAVPGSSISSNLAGFILYKADAVES